MDILVNSVWGASEESLPAPAGRAFWQRPPEDWDGMMTRGVRPVLMATRHAMPRMRPQRSGLLDLYPVTVSPHGWATVDLSRPEPVGKGCKRTGQDRCQVLEEIERAALP